MKVFVLYLYMSSIMFKAYTCLPLKMQLINKYKYQINSFSSFFLENRYAFAFNPDLREGRTNWILLPVQKSIILSLRACEDAWMYVLGNKPVSVSFNQYFPCNP